LKATTKKLTQNYVFKLKSRNKVSENRGKDKILLTETLHISIHEYQVKFCNFDGMSFVKGK